MRWKKVVAPLQTRVELHLTNGSGAFLCDDYRWNLRWDSSAKRYYVSLFFKDKKRIGFEFNKVWLLNNLWEKLFNAMADAKCKA